jgi:hypothetical protein
MDIIKSYINLVNGYKLITLAILIALDTVLGIIVAIKGKTFKWNKLTSFLNTSVLQLVGGYFLVGIFAVAEPSVSAALIAVWALMDAKLLADIVAKFQALGITVQIVTPTQPPAAPSGTKLP